MFYHFEWQKKTANLELWASFWGDFLLSNWQPPWMTSFHQARISHRKPSIRFFLDMLTQRCQLLEWTWIFFTGSIGFAFTWSVISPPGTQNAGGWRHLVQTFDGWTIRHIPRHPKISCFRFMQMLVGSFNNPKTWGKSSTNLTFAYIYQFGRQPKKNTEIIFVFFAQERSDLELGVSKELPLF